MALITGARLGPYEVLSVIGAGGMGEVYRARDTNLHRDVAIKVLPEAMAGNSRRLQRFEREARALAALNHPNIATVFSIEGPGPEHGRAIAMELVDGDDLSLLISRGALPLAEALPIARQVAEALAAAHDAGIVHRDLKPANIKVRADGMVKVLDFGLAQHSVADSDSGSGTGPHVLPPTLTHDDGLTRDGAVLGTAAYMAPEQARGVPVDKRADIWAFGVVLFEMLAGGRPFDSADTLEPDWTRLAPQTPPSIRRLLLRCLTVDRKQRLHDIADARLEIEEALHGPRPADVVRSRPRPQRLLWAALGLMVGVALGLAIWRRPVAAPLIAHVRLDVSPAAELNAGGVSPVVLPVGGARTAMQWSPDGRSLAFIGLRDGVRQIYLRDLSSGVARALAGTEGARTVTFSPDGTEVLFWVPEMICKVKITGGPVDKLVSVRMVNGVSWGPTRIVFSQGSLWELTLTPSGGEASVLTKPPELVRHSTPFLLPGEKALLYTEYQKQWTSGDERVMVRSLLPGGTTRVLLRNAADARYLNTGHLVFMRQGTLLVVPFDLAALEIRGEPVAVLKDVSQSVVAWDSDDLTLEGQFAVSPTGTLAYVSSPLPSYPERELVSIDLRGHVTPLGAPVRPFRNHVELSPDGTRLAVSAHAGTDIQLFTYDVNRGSLSRVGESLKGELILGAWSRSNQLAVGLVDEGRIAAAVIGPDAASPPVNVPETTGFWPSSLTPDGRLAGMFSGDVWIHFLSSPGRRPMRLAVAQAEETQPVWSPDGRWIAYTSTTTGRLEVHVRPFPGPGEAFVVSTHGGSSPAWSHSGRQLYYIEPGPDTTMMTVMFSADGRATKPSAVFSLPSEGLRLGSGLFTPYAVAKDGQTFYAVKDRPQVDVPVRDVHVIFNWLADLKSKLADGR